MVVRSRLLFLVVLGALLLPGTVAARQQSPVTVQVSAGFEGVYRTGQWFPITVDLTNSGSDIPDALLEWRFPGQIASQGDEIIFQRQVDLPQGANKRVVLSAFSNSFARNGELVVRSGSNEVLRQPVQLEPVDTRKFMVGVLSSDQALLNSLSAMSLAADTTTSVMHLTPTLLPEEATLLFGLDAIFVHDITASELTERQRAALTLWVQMGGQLIFSGGAAADSNATGLETLLPVDIGGLRGDTNLQPLADVPTQPVTTSPGTATVNQVQLRPNAQTLAADNLIVGRREGMGCVIFTAFDLSALRGWSGESQLWSSLLQFNERLVPGMIYRQQRENLLSNVLQLPELSLPGFASLLLFVVLYIAIIGPVNYLVLRRTKHPELAWLTIPVTVLVFVVGTYIYGLIVRGGQPQVAQITIVQGVEGQSRGQATGFVGLFSPQRRSYQLLFAGEPLVSEALSFDGRSSESIVRWTDNGTELPDTLVDVSSLRTFMFEQSVDVPVRVSSGLQRAANNEQVSGTVVNQSGAALEDALIVWGDAAQALGTLGPGASANVDLNARLSNFPGGASLASSEGRFNRRNALGSLFGTATFPLFGSNNFTQGMPDRNGIYLLGWRSDPTASVTLDGSSPSQDATTLYIMRLNVE